MTIPVDTRSGISASSNESNPRLVALIAAHNEEKSIGAALRSLSAQSRPPDAGSVSLG